MEMQDKSLGKLWKFKQNRQQISSNFKVCGNASIGPFRTAVMALLSQDNGVKAPTGAYTLQLLKFEILTPRFRELATLNYFVNSVEAWYIPVVEYVIKQHVKCSATLSNTSWSYESMCRALPTVHTICKEWKAWWGPGNKATWCTVFVVWFTRMTWWIIGVVWEIQNFGDMQTKLYCEEVCSWHFWLLRKWLCNQATLELREF